MLTDHPHFFTATIFKHQHLLQSYTYKQIVMESLRFLVLKGRITLYAFVLMPNHIHLIWQMKGKSIYSDVQRDFLKFTAQQFRFDMLATGNPELKNYEVNLRDRKYQFWKCNSVSIPLSTSEIVKKKLEYIHTNPLKEKWNLAVNPENYKYSSAAFYHWHMDDLDMLTDYTKI